MIVVNALITDAFRKCSLTMDGDVPTGDQAMAGLKDLQSVLSELNGQDLGLSNVETRDVTKGGIIRIVDKLPEGWYEVNEMPDPANYKIGDVIKYGQHVWYVGHNYMEQILIEFPEAQAVWPDLIISPMPNRVVGVGRKIGDRFIQLSSANRTLIDSMTRRSLASMYTCDIDLCHIVNPHKEYDFEEFVIYLDSLVASTFRITYLKMIPQYELKDKLYYNERLLSIIEDGLCSKLCLRYKLMDIKPAFDEEYANGLRLLKRANYNNRPATYQASYDDSPMANYYNLMAPRGW